MNKEQNTSKQPNVPHPSVPLLNLRALYLAHKQEYDSAIEEQLLNAQFIGGNEVSRFNEEFARWVGPNTHALGVANGTDAITLAALSLGIPKGKEAILPAMTYVATLEGILHAGFRVKLVDVEPGTWHMDPAQLQKAMTKDTALVVPVHFYGQMAEMDKISEIAQTTGCKILEDAAQASGALWKNRHIGFWGDVATYSFYPGKNLGAFGDAGGILSREAEIIKDCSSLANHGGHEKYVHLEIGFNSRLDTIQAAVLRIRLKYIDGWNEARRRIASVYAQELSSINGLELPVERPGGKHVYHLYVVLVEEREDFIAYLKKRSIECGIHYPKALHQHQACEGFEFSRRSFPQAERLAKHGVSLPMCPTLTDAQVQHVTSAIRGYFGK